MDSIAARDSLTAPPLTVGLPVYNGERFLADALDSILGQTFCDFRLVISDNASTDGTIEIIREYAVRDNRITLLENETNRGAAWNYNRVFAECTSRYFKWGAADDVLAPQCLERSLETLEASPPSVILAYPRTQILDADGRIVGMCNDSLAAPPGAAPHRRLQQVIRHVVLGNVVFAVVKTDALRQTRLHGNFPSADYVLLAELALVGEFREIEEPLFFRRLHEGISRRANTTPEALAHWFDPESEPVRSEALQLFRQHLAAIRHARLAPHERALTYTVFVATWTRRQLAPRTRVRRLLNRRHS